MNYKKLGGSGLKVSAIGLGCASFGTQVDETTSLQILNTAYENGVTLFDTADGYGRGRSEEILGEATKSWQRDQIVVSSKVRGLTGTGPNDIGLSRKHIMNNVERSLRRLQTDYIDIYIAHWPDPETAIEETLRTFNDLVHAGKIRYIGCSNFPAWQICKALWISDKQNLARLDCIEARYNLITRWAEYEVLPLCNSERLGVIVYNPLAGGFLTGKYSKDKQPSHDSQFGRLDKRAEIYQKRYWYDRNFEVVANLSKVATEYGHSLPHMALAWVISNPTVSSAIVGATTVDQMKQNLSCLEISVPEEEARACDQIWESSLPPGWLLQMGDDMINLIETWRP